MDIPDSGAVFTLGKAYLTDTPQNYFYIKNDPIRRIVAGQKQSAVICDSGRIFCWGENDCGQLAIDGAYSGRTNNSNNNIHNINGLNINKNNNQRNSTNTHHPLIMKPTCVRVLKTLGLRATDCAFGNGWSVMLTSTNQIFFSGRQIFTINPNSNDRFPEHSVFQGEKISISRKPFRLTEYDILSISEELENFVCLKAGFDHFIVQTSSGRLIGWGSNRNFQLGSENDHALEKVDSEELLAPVELIFDAPVKYFECGPQSTLVLTQTDTLFLTGCLNDFKFSQFTRLQQNLSPTEHIEFMHISITNEIFIVTNAGNIYRSKEMSNNKLLMFRPFHDYDSLENGLIWKILRGDNFFAALTKSHRFLTTFSESGHHLKTFREISKLKNLNVLDMALGEEHVLVFGVLKSVILANNLFNIDTRTANIDLHPENIKIKNSVEMTKVKKYSKRLYNDFEDSTEITHIEKTEKNTFKSVENDIYESSSEDTQIPLKKNAKVILKETNSDNLQLTSSHKSLHVELYPDINSSEQHTPSAKRLIRQNTPYPTVKVYNDSDISSTQLSTSATEEFLLKSNYDVVGGNMEDHLEQTSPYLLDSLEEPLHEITKTSINTFRNRDGEESITVETQADATVDRNLSQVIRFINDGVDVTEQTEQQLEQRLPVNMTNLKGEDVSQKAKKILNHSLYETNQVLEQSKIKLEYMDKQLNKTGHTADVYAMEDQLIPHQKVASAKNNKVGLLDQNITDEENTLLENSSNNVQLKSVREDDEGTTASMKSNHNFHDNPFDTVNNPDEVMHIDDDNAIIERGKYALQQELRINAQQVLRMNSQIESVTNKTNYMRQFYDDLKKNISCKADKNKAVIVDELNTHNTKNRELSSEEPQNTNNQSKICNIL